MDEVGVTAEGFGLRGPRGWAFRGVDVDAEPGSLIVTEGPSGSGRTSLLLALTGRMKATEGTATVGTARLPKQLSAVRWKRPGPRRRCHRPRPGPDRRRAPARTGAAGAAVRRLSPGAAADARGEGGRDEAARGGLARHAAGLDREALPKGARTAVRDLERLEALRLSVALALVGRPRLLGVDDADPSPRALSP